MQLERKTADALVVLARLPEFEVFVAWLDALNTGFTENAITGISNDPCNTPDVLRGRAQAMKIIKQEMAKAPQVASRIKQVK